MGTVVNYDRAEARPVKTGVSAVTLVDDSPELAASILRLSPSARYEGEVPSGSDQYFFVLEGDIGIEAAGRSAAVARQTFAIVQEGSRFALTAGSAAKVLAVVVPPRGRGTRALPGFTGGLRVMAVKDQPVVDIPEEKKHRVYLATKSTAGSERGHAMIVRYVGDTLTKKHHHPNADSMFIPLDNPIRFVVDGKERTLTLGEVVHFPANDSHGLRSADGRELSFLELHIPGAFATKYDE